MSEQHPPEETTIEELSSAPEYRPAPTTVGDDRATSIPDATAGTTATTSRPAGRRGIALRWGLALVGIVIVALGTALIVSLAGGRPATSATLGYMPASTVTFSEVRLDLPGDQRQKLASFLHAGKFPGFADQAQITPKIEDIYDRIVRLASKDQQTYTANIQPWFGGQLAMGQGLPDTATLGASSGMGGTSFLAVATVTDRAKAIAWVTSLYGTDTPNRSTYNGADVFSHGDSTRLPFIIAVTDKAMLAGTEADVKAAVDGNGAGPLAQDADMKAALATVDHDYVAFSASRIRSLAESYTKLIAARDPGVLDRTQLDETILGMIPAWQAATVRFEDDSLVSDTAQPKWTIGYDVKNETSDLLGHVPANALAYVEGHDVGPVVTAVLAKFRALPEAKPFFDQLDQGLSVLGGSDAVLGWWGDTAVVVAPGSDGTLGGGLLIHPRDAAAADRLLTTLRGFIALGGSSAGVVSRDEDHAGTKITVLDFSGMPNMSKLPAGYKAEIAFASNQDVTVLGYGRDFVASVLDAGPGHSLADDARFKALLGRVGGENMTSSFVDLTAIRKLIEPVAQGAVPSEKWAFYAKEIQPYLAPLDALVQSVRKDGDIDRGSSVLVVH
jgi:Protein of unknown function (DUF3352)